MGGSQLLPGSAVGSQSRASVPEINRLPIPGPEARVCSQLPFICRLLSWLMTVTMKTVATAVRASTRSSLCMWVLSCILSSPEQRSQEGTGSVPVGGSRV